MTINLNTLNLHAEGVYAAYKDAEGIQLTAEDPALALAEIALRGMEGPVYVSAPGRRIRCTITHGKNYRFTVVNGFLYEDAGAITDAIARYLDAGNGVIIQTARKVVNARR